MPRFARLRIRNDEKSEVASEAGGELYESETVKTYQHVGGAVWAKGGDAHRHRMSGSRLILKSAG